VQGGQLTTVLIVTPGLVSQDAGQLARLIRRTIAFPPTAADIAIAIWEMADSSVREAVLCLNKGGP